MSVKICKLNAGGFGLAFDLKPSASHYGVCGLALISRSLPFWVSIVKYNNEREVTGRFERTLRKGFLAIINKSNKPLDKADQNVTHKCSSSTSDRTGIIGGEIVCYTCRECGEEWERDVS